MRNVNTSAEAVERLAAGMDAWPTGHGSAAATLRALLAERDAAQDMLRNLIDVVRHRPVDISRTLTIAIKSLPENKVTE
jgi:hypothetical protein